MTQELAVDKLAITRAAGGGGGGVTAHSALTGLGADDHPHYGLVANNLAQFADVTHVSGRALAFNEALTVNNPTTLAGGTHSGTNTGDQVNITGNAATVTTNANLTGPITSTGNATAITALAVDTAHIAALAVTEAKVAAANKDGAAGTVSMRTLGTGAAQACAGNDSRLSDARTPTAHQTSHVAGADQIPTFAAGARGLVPDPGAPTSTNYLSADGTFTAPKPLGTPTVAHKASDQTFSSATLANVTSLSFSVLSGETYYFKFVLLVRSDTATVGIAASVTVPAITRFGAMVYTTIAADGTAAEYVGAVTTSGDKVSPTAVPAINTDYVEIVEGILIPSAGGTLQLQAATETGTTTVTVRQGSTGFLTKVT